MPAELSTILANLKKEAVSIAGSGRENALAVAGVLTERVVPEEGQPLPDFLAMQLSLVQMVETDLKQIETYDEALVKELDEDREQLAERNSAIIALIDELSSVQSATAGVYGVKASNKLFGNVETLPRNTLKLVKLGRRVHRRLADLEYALPEPKIKGWPLGERETVATDLGKAVDRLDNALAALTGERKSSDSSRFIKAGALDGFRRTLRYVADCLASLYGLAGFEDLAAKIRPKRRRRRRAAAGDGDEPNEQGATESPATGDDTTPAQPTGPTLVVS